jgi:hypothetical protein
LRTVSGPQPVESRAGIRRGGRLKSNAAPWKSALALAVALTASGAGSELAAQQQQENYSFTVALMAGLGGSFDAEPDPGLAESSFLVQAGMITEPRTLVSIRAGQLELKGDEGFEGYTDADLEFVNIAGEYRFRQSYYDYGIYLGVGYYKVTGDLRIGGDASESDLGAVFGLTGDFDITPHFSIVGDVSAHYAFLDSASLFGMAHLGVAFHF